MLYVPGDCRNQTPACRRVIAASARPVVVGEDVVPGPVEIVELAAFERAPENPSDREYRRDRKRDEQIKGFHGVRPQAASGIGRGDAAMDSARCRPRRELTITTAELAAMPSAACQGPIHPAAASGSTMTL